MGETDQENMADVLDAWLDSRLANVHTMIPGRIESYAGHTQRKATVKPLIKLRTKKGDAQSIPPIQNVPVVFPSSGSFSLLFPLNKGDGCAIGFAETGIGNFLNGVIEVDPDSISRFDLTDAVCYPGLWPFPGVPQTTTAATNVGLKAAVGTLFEIDNVTFSLGGLMSDLIDAVNGIVTTGSPVTHTLSPPSIAALTAIKTKFAGLLKP